MAIALSLETLIYLNKLKFSINSMRFGETVVLQGRYTRMMEIMTTRPFNKVYGKIVNGGKL